MVKKIFIEGMMCAHCQKSVVDTLSNIDGVKSVDVSLGDKCATVTFDGDIADDVFVLAISEIGFEVLEIR